jgi:hypothetical protein
MNMLELASVFNNFKVFNYLVNELNLKHKRDFCQLKEEKKIRKQYYMLAPVMRFTEGILDILLENTHLWTTPKAIQDLIDFAYLYKQMNWVNGIEKILDSMSMKKAYMKMDMD